MRRQLILVLAALLIGCAASPPEPEPAVEPPPAPTAAAVVPVEPVAPAPEPTPAAEPAPAAAPDASPDVVVGELRTTKGAQPVVDGLILAKDAFRSRFGDDWLKLLEGRKVRARGRKDIYRCNPMEQCLTSGEIPRLVDVTSIEVCASPKHPGKVGKHQPVPCD